MRASITLAAAAAFGRRGRGDRRGPASGTAGARRGAPVNPLDLTDADLHAGREAYARTAPAATAPTARSASRRWSADVAAGPLRGGTAGAQRRRDFRRHHRRCRGRAHAGVLRAVRRRALAAGGLRSQPRGVLGAGQHDGGAGYAWDLPPGFPQPKAPADNPMTAAKVALGRHLFYDTPPVGRRHVFVRHLPRTADPFTDGKGRAVDDSGQIHPRGAMSLANVADAPALTWANPTVGRLESAGAGADARHRSRGAGTAAPSARCWPGSPPSRATRRCSGPWPGEPRRSPSPT